MNDHERFACFDYKSQPSRDRQDWPGCLLSSRRPWHQFTGGLLKRGGSVIAALILSIALWLGLMAPIHAQDLPDWQDAHVNDFARLLGPGDAEAIRMALSDLRSTTGVEGTIVTLSDRATHGGADGLEPFATRLFNHWGVGDAGRKNGFMILVLANDREARIELGAGYPTEADIRAQDIMRNTMLPAFRDGRMSEGIRQGTEAVISLIARPGAPALAPAAASGTNWVDRALNLVFFGAFAAIFGAIGLRHWRRRHCPECGKGGLETAREAVQTPQEDGGYLVADSQTIRCCPHCGWSESRRMPMPRRVYYGPAGDVLRSERNPEYRARSGSGSSGFGGGSSRGGGASGRW
ncbi:TPM domain-containing protein [Paracoccus sp. MBLB3053]|uniref:TPM domain-containing protein n=1 Tax=Paracoccus aurantius TaxID=3073814 RepID=A0ABU2HUG1_9RHOB|nr:TPM domain-containing protein [Paracoccus sp. MBLB3053]MDS9468689.1 TPM domain-containing protein [Paracoccus sp. MBLB3053]